MQNRRSAVGGESDREGRGAGGAVTVSCFRTVCRALLPWAAAAALLFGGGLAAQAQSIAPEDECTVDGTTVTCKGDLSGGVEVDGGTGTYTTLYVNELDGDIAPVDGTTGIEFTGDGAVTLNVNTGGHDITTSGRRADGIKAYSENTINVDVVTGHIGTSGEGADGIDVEIASGGTGTIDVDVTGDITTDGASSKGVRVVGRGDTVDVDVDVDVDVTGDITTYGANSDGVSVSGNGGAVDVDVTGNIETRNTTGSSGIYVTNTNSIEIELTGDINVRSEHGIVGSVTENVANLEIIVQGDITNLDAEGSAINAFNEKGDIAITLNGGIIRSSGLRGIWFSDQSSDTINSILKVTAGSTVRIEGGTRDVEGEGDNETIDNYGTLTTPGTVHLGEGNNRFNNWAGATYISGTAIILGDDDEDIFINEGNLSPGGDDAVKTTTLTGDFNNFTIDAEGNVKAGIITVTIDPEKGYDQFIVTGTITLNGGTVRVVGAYDDVEYTILKSMSTSIKDVDPNRDTEYAIEQVDVIDTLFMNYGLKEDDNSTFEMVLTSSRNGEKFCDDAGTAGQRAGACNAFDNMAENNSLKQAVLQVGTREEVNAFFDAFTDQLHASLKGALADTGQARVAAVKNRMNARFGNPGARLSTVASGNRPSLADERSGLWISGYGASGKTDATADTARMDTDLDGVVFGIDRALGEGGRFGVLGGYSRTDVSQRARLSSASVDTWSAGLYGGAEDGASRLSFGAVYNRHAIDASRSVPPIGVSEIQNLWASYDATSWQVFAEAGHRMQFRDLTLEPFAGVSHTSLDTDGFSESGGDAALTSSSGSDSTTFTTLGMRGTMALLDTVRVRGMAGWRHAFGDTDPSSTVVMQGSADPFTATGAPTAEDALVAELGIEAGLSDSAVLGVAYKGRFGGGADHGVNAGITVKF